jgi:hypothetical protein
MQSSIPAAAAALQPHSALWQILPHRALSQQASSALAAPYRLRRQDRRRPSCHPGLHHQRRSTTTRAAHKFRPRRSSRTGILCSSDPDLGPPIHQRINRQILRPASFHKRCENAIFNRSSPTKCFSPVRAFTDRLFLRGRNLEMWTCHPRDPCSARCVGRRPQRAHHRHLCTRHLRLSLRKSFAPPPVRRVSASPAPPVPEPEPEEAEEEEVGEWAEVLYDYTSQVRPF